jgi:hypothetical protein
LTLCWFEKKPFLCFSRCSRKKIKGVNLRSRLLIFEEGKVKRERERERERWGGFKDRKAKVGKMVGDLVGFVYAFIDGGERDLGKLGKLGL